MKVLILTANTGGGHNAAAAAIADGLSARGIEYCTENALRFVPKAMENTLVGTHSFGMKYIPELYGAGYEISEQSPNNYGVYLSFAMFAPILRNYILEGGFDTVICTHVFAAHMMTAIRRNWPMSLKQYFVVTDYTCSPSVEEVEADAIFIPRRLALQFTMAGMDPKNLVETGIPVRPACYERMDKPVARERLYHECALSADDHVVFVAPGCLDFDDIRRLTEVVADEDPRAKIIVVCGKHNSTLRRRLIKLGHPALRVLGFTKNMQLWMKAADAVITKPGGLTSTEAVSTGVPVILLEFVPGLETHNRDWLVSLGCASTATGLPAIACETLRLLSDEAAAEAMVAAQRTYFSDVAVDALVATIMAQDADRAAEASYREERDGAAECDF